MSLLVVVLALWLVVGCASPEQKEKGAGPTAGEFVGEIPEADAFLALVAEGPQEGGDTRGIRAYLCDGKTFDVNEWFQGSASGDELGLFSEKGAQLEGRLSPQCATGAVTLPDGARLDFEAHPATGITGYYPVSVTSDGRVSGTTWGGAQVEGSISGGGEISGTITSADGGEPSIFEEVVPSAPLTEGEHRWIVLAEDEGFRIKGKKQGPEAEFIDREDDL
ncbi:MAG TPA: hypothetical protein VHF46_00380 [Rubrobacteraceae bacterium]|nr:hypothetical protein [Rubrobacteraceae bacterium]